MDFIKVIFSYLIPRGIKMHDVNNWVLLLGNFGFPILIAVYLLIRFERKIEALTSVIIELKNSIKNRRK